MTRWFQLKLRERHGRDHRGGLGGQLLGALGVVGGTAAAAGTQAGGRDTGSLSGQVAGGGVGGGILMIIIGFIKQAIAK
jgi:hypothetical protein